MLQVSLKVVGGKHDGREIQLKSRRFLIGREEDCQLRPNSDLISRHHCVITVDDYSVRVRDLGSRNGTYVNGERMQGERILTDDDRVRVGSLEFQVLITEVETQPEASPAPEAGLSGSDFAVPQGDSGDSETREIQIPSALSQEAVAEVGNEAEAPMQPAAAQQPWGQPPPDYYQQNPPQGGFPPQGNWYYPQMPWGYQPPPGYAPPPGYPQQQGSGYPPQYPPPGYGYPPQGGPPQGGPPAGDSGEIPKPAANKANAPEIRLPDPSTTGLKEEAPQPAAKPADDGVAKPKTPSEKAAEMINQRNRRG